VASGKAVNACVSVKNQAASALPLVLMLPPQRRKRSSIRRNIVP
jgi:hypothetical protein